jgi:hypothetical protein
MTERSIKLSTGLQAFLQFWRELAASRAGNILLGCSLVLLALLLDRGQLMLNQVAPSGSDPGNWLTFAWEMGGSHYRLAEWAYPPLFPLLLRGALSVMEPMAALKVTGLLVWALVGISFFISLSLFFKNLSFLFRLGFSIFLMLSGYQGEIFAWGGYPQLLGFAFLILSVPLADEWIATGDRRKVVFACIFASSAIYTHQLVAFVQAAMLFVLVLWRIIPWRGNTDFWQKIRRILVLAAGCALLSIGAIPSYLNYVRYLDVNPANLNGFSLSSVFLALTYPFQDSVYIWLILIAFVSVIIFIYPRHPAHHTVVLFLCVPILLFALTWEVRILQSIFAGVGYGIAMAFNEAQETPREGTNPQILKGLHYLILCGILILTLPNTRKWFSNALDYYQIVDNRAYEGLQWIKDNTTTDEIVFASAWKPFNIGWWIEGYTQRPTIYATDLRWLVFREERTYATLANHFFDEKTSPADMTAILHNHRARLIFLDKEVVAQAEINKISRLTGTQKAFENGRVIIFQVSKPGN